MEAGALSYCWGKYQEIRVYLVVPGRTERVPSIVVQFALWVSYNTEFRVCDDDVVCYVLC